MSALPTGFTKLEPFVRDWAFATEKKRSEKRWSSTKEDFQVFYDAMLECLTSAFEEIDKYEIGKMPEQIKILYYLVLAFAEASPHVELYKGDSKVPYSFDAERFVASHGDISD
ncbi:MAG: hypothetical protein COB36_09475 [Alphaproteobacteria bacterium]|nr:MAG: hypothetical protein COB36_09475 [Alphaproteobacteria bacterium]